MDDYRDEVERLARARTGEPIYNSSVDHAAVIVEKLFRHARNNIRIISGSLKTELFGQEALAHEARAFLELDGTRLEIAIENDVESLDQNSEFVKVLSSFAGRVELRKMQSQVPAAVKYHFTLADDDSYRFEPDKTESKAVGVFGDTLGAKKLREAFDVIWGASETVAVPATA
jgi:hypothetical protein